MHNLESPAPKGDSDAPGGLAAPRLADAAGRVSRRPSPVARRVGYVIAAVINVVIWYLVNVHPTWHAVRVLTLDTRLVVPWFNLSWFATMAVNLLFVAYDPRWLVAAGNVLTTTLGLVALISLMTVFPFDFPTQGWTTAAHALLIVAIVGSAFGVVIYLIKLATAMLGRSDTRRL
ncbi:MAG TPA: hypothetical protein VH442_06515 [Micromonosporaceae bacterium]